MTGTLTGVARAAVVHRMWRREGIWTPGAAPDTTTEAHWLQLGTWYCDLRQPADLPPVDAGSPTDHVRALARQEAFAGRLLQDGEVWTWTRDVDLHPPADLPDAGRLALDGDVVVETGVGRDYVERWAAVETGPEPTPRQELVLRGEDGRAGLLLRLGDRFGYVRDRAVPLPPGAALRDLVAGSDLAAVRELLDLEVSLGVVVGGAWRITRSTLPLRVGCLLQPQADGDPALLPTDLTTADLTADGRPVRRRWRVTT
ncbi:hypothetical protein ACI79D_14490 [Geodermatophilus sp. SYSU D00708]